MYMRAGTKGVTRWKKAGALGLWSAPYNSFAWNILEPWDEEGWFNTVYFHCCFGGSCVKWIRLIPFLRRALRRPECLGHQGFKSYYIGYSSDGALAFDTALEAEYSSKILPSLQQCPGRASKRDHTCTSGNVSPVAVKYEEPPKNCRMRSW